MSQGPDPQPAAPPAAQPSSPPAPPASPPVQPQAGPAPAQEPQSPPATPAPPGGIRQALAAQGVAVDQFGSDEEAMGALIGAIRDSERLRPYAEMGQQVAPNWQQYQQFLQQQGQPPQQPQPPDSSWTWDAPPFEREWLGYLDDFGRVRPDAPAHVQSGIERYRGWREDQQQRFWSDPRQLIEQAIKDQLEQRPTQEVVEQLVEAKLREGDERRARDEWMRENERELFQHDQAGNRVYDLHGQAVLTERGRATAEHLQDAERRGLTGETMWDWVERGLAVDAARGRFVQPGNGNPAQPGQAPPPAGDASVPNQDGRQTFLEAAIQAQQARPPVPYSSDGTVPRVPGERVAGPYRSAREIAERILRESGDLPPKP